MLFGRRALASCLSVSWLAALCAAASALVATSIAAAQEPLRTRIDRLLAQTQVAPPASLASDADFLRRVSLDLTGMVPTAEQARQFLDNPSPAKRAELVERLLASPQFSRHMAVTLDVTLMERRPDKHVPAADWHKYLRDSIAACKPLDQLVLEILSADGTDEKNRPAAKFFLDREGDPHLLTRDVGRIFFGKDFQCAQCHDHPLINDYLQTDYHGVLAFFIRTTLFTDPKQNNKALLAEKAEGEANYQSVFVKDAKGIARPHLPGGADITDQTFPAGEEYVVKPEANVRHVPKFSRREQIAKDLIKDAATGGNPAFRRNWANRLWAHLMGRGLVEPVDLHHTANPPAQPELLEMLSVEFVAMKYDIRAFLREIALSEAYQRSIEPPQTTPEHIKAATDRLAAVEAEVAALSQAAEQAQSAWAQAREKLTTAEKAAAAEIPLRDQATAATTAAKQTSDTASKAVADTQTQLAAKQEVVQVVTEAAGKAQAAAAKLPGDAEVAAAAATLQNRMAQTTAEMTALQQTLAQKQAEAQTAAQALAAATKTLEEANARLAAAQGEVEKQRQQVGTVAAERNGKRISLTSAQGRVQEIKDLTSFAPLLAELQTARAAMAAVQSEAAANAQAQQQATALVAQKQQEMAGAQAAYTAATQKLEQTRAQTAAASEKAKQVSALATQAEGVRQKFTDDAELADAAKKLQARTEQLAAEVAAVEKALATITSETQAASQTLESAKQAVAQSEAALAVAKEAGSQIAPRLAAATQEQAAKQGAAQPVIDKLTERWTRHIAVGPMRPLTPEQLAWSMMQATGVVEQHAKAVAAEFDAQNPAKEGAEEAERQTRRIAHIENGVYERLKGNVPAFVGLFGASAGLPQSDFFSTVDQALFVSNGGVVLSWLAPGGGNLAERLIAQQDPALVADELYVSVFTRRPTDEEKAEAAQILAARAGDKPGAVQDLIWSLMASAEFRFGR